MFIISLTYKVAIEKVERHIPEHTSFLQKYYDSGLFIASGRKSREPEELLYAMPLPEMKLSRSLQKTLFTSVR